MHLKEFRGFVYVTVCARELMTYKEGTQNCAFLLAPSTTNEIPTSHV